MLRVALFLAVSACFVYESRAIQCKICQAFVLGEQLVTDDNCGTRQCPGEDDQSCASFDATVTAQGGSARLRIRDCVNALGCAIIENNPDLLQAIISSSAPDDASISDIRFNCCGEDGCNSEGLSKFRAAALVYSLSDKCVELWCCRLWEINQNRSKLTEHDRDVINRIFSPHNPNVVNFDDIADSCNEGSTQGAAERQSQEVESESDKLAKSIELEAVRLAEAGQIEAAVVQFGKAIEASPRFASAYNNRAQAYRILGKNAAACDDLDTAIRLSNGVGKVARQAYTQRGLLRRLAGDDAAARIDFEQAAQLGSEFARNQAIALNPYSALCANMLTKMFRQVTEGRPSDEEAQAGQGQDK